MVIFCIFSYFAGVLIYFLPETSDLPLPDTMKVRVVRRAPFTRAIPCLPHDPIKAAPLAVHRRHIDDDDDDKA